ncbi:hypothetical protein ABGB12_15580 [Actinocorallia sp. B10E7]|uniref:hypothetical protein n=1 Tax=Actinocorallia sp. B10E7 TaxID=3153558 RepID=UPI00325D8B78
MRSKTLLGLTGAVLAAVAGPAAADDATPTPLPTVDTAGTSFLTATTVRAGQPVRVPASTGDYLYWSFAAAAGQTGRITVNVTLPDAASRHGAATWTVDVFDGLRRRQSCTAGAQTATAEPGSAAISLGCVLRRIRSWAEPWSSDPLPGTYYIRLAATALPEQDLGLPIQTSLDLALRDGTAQPDGAALKAPLSPPVNPGATLAPDTDPSSSAVDVVSAPKPAAQARSWFSRFSTRWAWTAAGGVLAALLGVVGYHLTRHPRRRLPTPH